MCHFTTLGPFKEDACPVTLAEEEVINPRPTLIYVSVQEFLPDKLQPIGNTLPFCQTKIDLVLSATYAATEACCEGFHLPLSSAMGLSMICALPIALQSN